MRQISEAMRVFKSLGAIADATRARGSFDASNIVVDGHVISCRLMHSRRRQYKVDGTVRSALDTCAFIDSLYNPEVGT
jgi:hypothetical protein